MACPTPKDAMRAVWNTLFGSTKPTTTPTAEALKPKPIPRNKGSAALVHGVDGNWTDRGGTVRPPKEKKT